MEAVKSISSVAVKHSNQNLQGDAVMQGLGGSFVFFNKVERCMCTAPSVKIIYYHCLPFLEDTKDNPHMKEVP